MTVAELTTLYLDHKEGKHLSPNYRCAMCREGAITEFDGALAFSVETHRKHGWKSHYEPIEDLFVARRVAASLASSQGIETRVIDSNGQVWA